MLSFFFTLSILAAQPESGPASLPNGRSRICTNEEFDHFVEVKPAGAILGSMVVFDFVAVGLFYIVPIAAMPLFEARPSAERSLFVYAFVLSSIATVALFGPFFATMVSAASIYEQFKEDYFDPVVFSLSAIGVLGSLVGSCLSASFIFGPRPLAIDNIELMKRVYTGTAISLVSMLYSIVESYFERLNNYSKAKVTCET